MAGIATRPPGKRACAEDYLRALSCSSRLLRGLFEPILVSALNEELAGTSAAYARMVLSGTLLGKRDGWRLGVPSAPMEEVLAAPAARYLAERGAQVALRTRVTSISAGDGGMIVTLASGETVSCDSCVCAVPPWHLSALGVETEAARALRWRPIIAAHLFFEHRPPRFDQVCLVDEPFQWVFSKGTGQSGLLHMQAVASAAGLAVDLAKDELVALALSAVASAVPSLDPGSLRNAVIIRERRATFSTGGGIDAIRPPTAGHRDGIFLAGDWTDTHWPATIESAVRSGRAAARAVLERG